MLFYAWVFIAHWEFDVVISFDWLLYPFGTLACWWYWLTLLLVLAYWICSCHDYPAHFDMYVHIFVYLVVLVLTLLLVYYLDHLWACYPCCILLDCHVIVWLMCGHGWYTCNMPDYLLHNFSSPVWLHVACLCGSHIYPLTSNPLVSITLLFLVLTFVSVRPCVHLFSDRASWLGVGSSDRLYRCLGAFWKRWTYWCWLESDLWKPI